MKEKILGIMSLILIMAMITLVGTAIVSQIFKGTF